MRDRLASSDMQRARMAGLIQGQAENLKSTGRDNRMFVEAVPWIVRAGAPWRDLPEIFGPWNTSFRRFSRRSAKGAWQRILAAMAEDTGFKYLIVAARSCGPISMPLAAKGAQPLGRSCGGLSSKRHLSIRGLVCPTRIMLAAGRSASRRWPWL